MALFPFVFVIQWFHNWYNTVIDSFCFKSEQRIERAERAHNISVRAVENALLEIAACDANSHNHNFKSGWENASFFLFFRLFVSSIWKHPTRTSTTSHGPISSKPQLYFIWSNVKPFSFVWLIIPLLAIAGIASVAYHCDSSHIFFSCSAPHLLFPYFSCLSRNHACIF